MHGMLVRTKYVLPSKELITVYQPQVANGGKPFGRFRYRQTISIKWKWQLQLCWSYEGHRSSIHRYFRAEQGDIASVLPLLSYLLRWVADSFDPAEE